MNQNDIKYIIDNYELIYKDIEEIFSNLSDEQLNDIEGDFSNSNIINIFDFLNSNYNEFIKKYNLTQERIKIFYAFATGELKKILGNKVIQFFKELVNIYGINVYDKFNMDNPNFNIGDIVGITFDSNYDEFSKYMVERKSKSLRDYEKFIEFINAVNPKFISNDIINNFFDNHYEIDVTDGIISSILKNIPKNISDYNIIVENCFEKINKIGNNEYEFLKSINFNDFDYEFSKMIISKSYHYNVYNIFDLIPKKYITKEIYDIGCNVGRNLIMMKVPYDNMGMSDDEFIKWKTDKLKDFFSSLDDDITNKAVVFSILDNSLKTEELIDYMLDLDNDISYIEKIIEGVPKEQKTISFFEKIIAKNQVFLKIIPENYDETNINEKDFEEFINRVFCDAIDKIDNEQDLNDLITINRCTSVIWNKKLDKCIEKKWDLKICSLDRVKLSNITPQMIKRYSDEYAHAFFCVPCVDVDIERLKYDSERNWPYGETIDWIASLSEEKKEEFRKVYEESFLIFLEKNNKSHPNLSNVSPKAMTFEMGKRLLINEGVNVLKIINYSKEEFLQVYEDIILYGLSKSIGKYDKTDKLFSHISHIYNFDFPSIYLTDKVKDALIRKSPYFLKLIDVNDIKFEDFLNMAYSIPNADLGKEKFTQEEIVLLKEFYKKNKNVFSTLDIRIFNPVIINSIGINNFERLINYPDIQTNIAIFQESNEALQVFSFMLNKLKDNNNFGAPFIEKVSQTFYYLYRNNSQFFNIINDKINDNNYEFSEKDYIIIQYLSTNYAEASAINSFEDIINYVEKKNDSLDEKISSPNISLIETKNIYLQRLIGMNFANVCELIESFGNDTESLLKYYYQNNDYSYEELAEKEALEIIIKIKTLLECDDIDLIKEEYNRFIKQEGTLQNFRKLELFLTLEKTLKRAYGRNLQTNLAIDSYKVEERAYNNEVYHVKKLTSNFNRVVTVMGAYRQGSHESDFYDKWNTREHANNHALCYSLINNIHQGTALFRNDEAIIVSISEFSPEALVAAAPYDLCSDSRYNTTTLGRKQKFFTAENLPKYTRGRYSELDIEISDLLDQYDKESKIQPSSIICFEEIDEKSIIASIELSRKLGKIIPIELIDRRKLAKGNFKHIESLIEEFKSDKTLDTKRIEDIIDIFCSIRNAHLDSKLSDELVGENKDKENPNALFNKQQINNILKNIIEHINIEIKNGNYENGIKALEEIKDIIKKERNKSFLMPTTTEKIIWTGIDEEIDYQIDYIIRSHKSKIIKSSEIIPYNFETFLEESPLFREFYKNKEQYTQDEIKQILDFEFINDAYLDIKNKGLYNDNIIYGEQYIYKIIMYSNIISKNMSLDDKYQKLLIEAAKYSSAGRLNDSGEKHEEYSAILAEKYLKEIYSVDDINIIKAVIHMQQFKYKSLKTEERKQEYDVYLEEICNKYNIKDKEAVSQLYGCLHDAIELDKLRFVNSPNAFVSEPRKFQYDTLETEVSKKLMDFCCRYEETLAKDKVGQIISELQLKLDRYDIMEVLFTKYICGVGTSICDKNVTDSNIVQKQYIEKKYKDVLKYIEVLEERKEILDKQITKEQLLEQRKKTIYQLFQQKLIALGIKEESLTIEDIILEQEKMLKENIELGEKHTK